MRLVPEDPVGAGIYRCVCPGSDEGTKLGTVRACRPHEPAVVQDLADVRAGGGEEAFGLTTEGIANPPRIDLHLEPSLVGNLDDAPHVAPVVIKVVL